MKYEKNGQTFEFSVDFDKIADMEEADPTFDVSAIFEEWDSGKLRFCTLRKVIRLLGVEDYKELRDKGLDFDDLASIFSGCIEELGFSSGAQD